MRVDIIAEDRHEEPFLLADVEIRPTSPEDRERFVSELLSADPRFSFGILADPEKIVVLRENGHPGPLVELDAGDVLSHYDSEYHEAIKRRGTPGIFHDFLTVLVMVWLDDLIRPWKSDTPPGAEQLSRIGLRERLKGGATYFGSELKWRSLIWKPTSC